MNRKEVVKQVFQVEETKQLSQFEGETIE